MPDLRDFIAAAAAEQARRDTSSVVPGRVDANGNPVSYGVVTTTPEDSYRWARWAGLMGSGAADALTTRAAIERGGQEANPFVGPLANSTAGLLLFKAAMNGGLGLLTDRVAKESPVAANVLAGLVTALQAGLAVHNSRVARK